MPGKPDLLFVYDSGRTLNGWIRAPLLRQDRDECPAASCAGPSCRQKHETCLPVVCRKQLARAAPRTAYYPGSEARAADFCKAFPDAEEFGSGDGVMPWRFKAGLTPDEVRLDKVLDASS